MNIDDRYAKIRKALESGPTPGLRVIKQDQVQSGTEWHMLTGETHYRVLANVPVASDRDRADAAFLAACDPDTIRELLAERDALAAEVKRLRAERDALTEAALADLAAENERLKQEIAATQEKLIRANDELIQRNSYDEARHD